MTQPDRLQDTVELTDSSLSRSWRSKWLHQVVALVMVMFVWIAYYQWARSNLPQMRALVGNLAYLGVFLGWGAAFLLYRRRVSRGMEESAAWFHYLVQIIWICSLMAFLSWSVQAPYADAERRTLGILVSAALVAAGSIITVRPPSEGRMGWSGAVVPLALPACLIGYYIFHPGEKAMPMAPLFAIFAGLMLTLRGTIQTMANDAHARVVRAEAAQREAQMARERFLVAASHDLSQPLQAARLSVDQAVRAPADALRKKAVDRVDWALDSMEAMIGQIMEHLKLDAGTTTVRREQVIVQDLFERLQAIHGGLAQKAGVRLAFGPSGIVAQGDTTLIQRIVGNLITNALRHAKASRILVGVRRKGDRLRIWVIDDGLGILPQDEAGLFDDFVQGNHLGEIRGGYGLGLSSARRTATLMAGEVGYDRRWRKGSAFYLDLPVA